jgi:hypothetical protein
MENNHMRGQTTGKSIALSQAFRQARLASFGENGFVSARRVGF